jgi:hypothetical protein
MKSRFPLEDVIRTDAPQEWAAHLAYSVSSLIRVARLALENETSGLGTDAEKAGAVADALEVAEALNSIVINGTERLQMEVERGIWKKEEAA